MSADYYQEYGAVARDAAGTDITEYITKTIEKYNEETGGWEIIGQINDPHENDPPWTVPHIDTTQPGAQYRIRYNVKDVSNQPAEEVERVITIDRPSSMHLNYIGLRDDGIVQTSTNYVVGDRHYFLQRGGLTWYGEDNTDDILWADSNAENDIKTENHAWHRLETNFGDLNQTTNSNLILYDIVTPDHSYEWTIVKNLFFVAYDLAYGMLAYRSGIVHFYRDYNSVESYGDLEDQNDDNYYSWLSENIENIRDLRSFFVSVKMSSICLMGNGDLVGAEWTDPTKMQSPPIIKSKIRSIVAADLSRNGGLSVSPNNNNAVFICEDFSRDLWWIYYDAANSSWGSKKFNLNIKAYEIQAITIHEQNDLCRIVLKSDTTKMYNYTSDRSNYQTKSNLTNEDLVAHDFLDSESNILAIYCSMDFVLITEDGMHIENNSTNQYGDTPLPYSVSILDDDKEESPGAGELSWTEFFTMYEFDKIVPSMDMYLTVIRYVLKQEYLHLWSTENPAIFPAIYILCPSPVTHMTSKPIGAGVKYLQGRPQRSYAQETIERLFLEGISSQVGRKTLDMNPDARAWNE